MPGPWGTNVPVQSVDVKIVDIDAPGKKDDTILAAKTNNNGLFDGTTSDWQDTVSNKITVTVPSSNPFQPPRLETRTVTAADVTDVMVLRATVSQTIGGNIKTVTLPFIYINDNTESPPLIVPWGPPPKPIGKINNTEVNTPEEMFTKTSSLIDSGANPITIEIYAPYSDMLQSLDKSRTDLAKWMMQRLGIPDLQQYQQKLTGGEIAGIIIAVSILILAIGAALALVILALSVLYAVHKGYSLIDAELETGPNGEHKFKIKLGK